MNLTILIAGFFAVALFAFNVEPADQKPWPVPESAKNKTNPLKADLTSVATEKICINNIVNPAMDRKVKETAQSLPLGYRVW